MPDFVQLGLPSSTASSMEIGSTLLADQVDWGTDLLNDRYVQTVQAEGGVLAVELAPNRKVTLPFIYKGTNPDDANQFIQALQRVTAPGNILDVRPEGASWITRFDIEGARVIAKRDIRYHRQSIMQGTVELYTRPWGYTPTWMIAASVTAQKPWIPFAASVIGDLPAHTRWNFFFKPAAAAVTNVGGVVIGQHAMPSYRTIWGAQVGNANASVGMESLAANPSMVVMGGGFTASSISFDVKFAQVNVAGEPEVQNMASSTRAFAHVSLNAASQAGGFGFQLGIGTRVISRPAFLVKPLGAQPLEAQMLDFGEISKTQLMEPITGAATQNRLQMHPLFDPTAVAMSSGFCFVDALVLIPNAGVMVINNPPNGAGVPGDVWGQGAISSSYNVFLDTKLQRMWRPINGGSAISVDLTGSVRGGWPLIYPVGASGAAGVVVGPLSADPEALSIPYAQASTSMQIQVIYQPRWLLFR